MSYLTANCNPVARDVVFIGFTKHHSLELILADAPRNTFGLRLILKKFIRNKFEAKARFINRASVRADCPS